MIRAKSQIDYHSHLQMGRNEHRLLNSDGRRWDEGLVGLALIVSSVIITAFTLDPVSFCATRQVLDLQWVVDKM
jgi:hypothetical protein